MDGLINDRARQSLTFANQIAMDWGHEWIEPQHLLLGLIREGSGFAAKILNDHCDDAERLAAAIKAAMIRGPHPSKRGKLPMSLASKRAIEFALVERGRLRHNLIGNEHLLLGVLLLHEPTIDSVFRSIDVDHEQMRLALLRLMGDPELT